MLWCRVRVVKEIDLKSIGLCPRRFEPCRHRFFNINKYKMNIEIYDIVLVNILSYMVGIFSGLAISYRYCKEKINHDNPREIGTTYPFTNISPALTQQNPTAPPPFNLNGEQIVEAQPPQQTEIIIKNNQ